jgi:hypothetical protein
MNRKTYPRPKRRIHTTHLKRPPGNAPPIYTQHPRERNKQTREVGGKHEKHAVADGSEGAGFVDEQEGENGEEEEKEKDDAYMSEGVWQGG